MSDAERKVMIIDDDIISLMKAEELLVSNGYTVVKLASAHGCLAKLDYERPDVLLVDIQMSRLAADDLLDSVRASPEHQELIIVLYSDMDAEELEEICHAKDINGYFCKSMELVLLGEFIDQFF